MKKLILLLFSITWVSYTIAQNQYATTSNGKKVLLKPNGTWEYVNVTTSKSFYSTVNGSSNNSTKKSSRKSISSSSSSSGRSYIRGSRGGCYYINKNGNKTYVDRSMCN